MPENYGLLEYYGKLSEMYNYGSLAGRFAKYTDCMQNGAKDNFEKPF